MIEGRRAVAIDGEQLQLQLFLPASSALAQNRDEVQAVLEKLKALGCDSFGFGWHAAGAFYTDGLKRCCTVRFWRRRCSFGR